MRFQVIENKTGIVLVDIRNVSGVDQFNSNRFEVWIPDGETIFAKWETVEVNLETQWVSIIREE